MYPARRLQGLEYVRVDRVSDLDVPMHMASPASGAQLPNAKSAAAAVWGRLPPGRSMDGPWQNVSTWAPAGE